MPDAISREQAIKALGELATFTEDWSCHTWMYTDDVYNAIKQLPPIQPEITHEQAVAYLQSTGWMQEHDRQMMLDGAHRLTAQPESHWIPVAEQLPEVGKSVLICDAYGDICLGHRTQWGYYYPDLCEDKVKDVRAWCELPKPYKGATT